MKRIVLVDNDNGVQKEIPFQDVLTLLQDNKEKSEKIFWVDCFKPTEAELEQIADLVNIHHLTVEDIQNRRAREKSEDFDNYLYVVAQALNFNPEHELLKTVNLSILVFKNFVLSFHYRALKSVDQTLKRIQQECRNKLPNEDWAFYAVLDAIVDLYTTEIDLFYEKVEAVDNDVLSFQNPEIILEKLGKSRRTLSQFRRRLGPKKEFLQQLIYRDNPLVSRPTKILLRDVYDHVIRMQEVMDIARDTLATAQSNYLAQVSNRMNVVMKTLSIVATIMLPLSLLTGMFGMNVHVPGQEAEGIFWFAGLVVVMILGAISMIIILGKEAGFR